MNFMAEEAQALVAVEKAIRLDPDHHNGYGLEEGFAYLGLGEYWNSIYAYKGFLALYPDIFWAHLGLAVAYIEIGQDDDARAEATEVLRLNPQFTLEMTWPILGPKGKLLAEQTRWDADLRKAGLK